jgi:DNA-directed RNA polymerase sigma subunit (sigma70/sigma32)
MLSVRVACDPSVKKVPTRRAISPSRCGTFVDGAAAIGSRTSRRSLTRGDTVTTPASRTHRLTADIAEADRRAAELVGRMAALPHDDPARAGLREQAIEAWLPMAGRLARRYANRGQPFDDLRQTAVIGLIKAVDGFDPARGSDFVSYAIPTILGEIKRYFRDRTWTMRVPRRLQELRVAINNARRSSNTACTGRSRWPTSRRTSASMRN